MAVSGSQVRIGVLGTLVAAGLAWLLVPKHAVTGVYYRATNAGFQAHPTQPTVLLVVLDTVRADHVGSCGYERPTSPFLAELVGRGASLSCEARAPGSWTLPSHASFFTGLSVVDHGADMASGACDGCFGVNGQGAHPLGPDSSTLAEQFASRGYQTAMVSMNPVLASLSGLQRGFAHTFAAEAWPGPRGEDLIDEVRTVLRHQVNPDAPLFLFVNIAEAHDPFAPVGSGHPFLPARAKRDYTREEGSEWEGLLGGKLEEGHRQELLEHLTDLYDHGVERSDATLRRVVEVVSEHGWDGAGLRLVVVSDHGEYLGEHDLFYHGLELFEGQQRVPLLVWDTQQPTSLPPGPLAGVDVFQLTLTGRIDAPSPVMASTSRNPWMAERQHAALGGTTVAAEWVGQRKRLARADQVVETALATDPAELAYGPVTVETTALSLLFDRAQALDRSTTSDAELMEMLKSAGYIEDEP